MEHRSELDEWKRSALSWQTKAMQASSVTPRGSALDAIPVRRAEMAARAVLCKVYTGLRLLDSGMCDVLTQASSFCSGVSVDL